MLLGVPDGRRIQVDALGGVAEVQQAAGVRADPVAGEGAVLGRLGSHAGGAVPGDHVADEGDARGLEVGRGAAEQLDPVAAVGQGAVTRTGDPHQVVLDDPPVHVVLDQQARAGVAADHVDKVRRRAADERVVQAGAIPDEPHASAAVRHRHQPARVGAHQVALDHQVVGVLRARVDPVGAVARDDVVGADHDVLGGLHRDPHPGVARRRRGAVQRGAHVAAGDDHVVRLDPDAHVGAALDVEAVDLRLVGGHQEELTDRAEVGGADRERQPQDAVEAGRGELGVLLDGAAVGAVEAVDRHLRGDRGQRGPDGDGAGGRGAREGEDDLVAVQGLGQGLAQRAVAHITGDDHVVVFGVDGPGGRRGEARSPDDQRQQERSDKAPSTTSAPGLSPITTAQKPHRHTASGVSGEDYQRARREGRIRADGPRPGSRPRG